MSRKLHPCLLFFTGFVQYFKRLEIFQFLKGPFLALEKVWKMGEACPGLETPHCLLFFTGFVQSFERLEMFRDFEGPFLGLEKVLGKRAMPVWVWKQYRLDQNLEIFPFL